METVFSFCLLPSTFLLQQNHLLHYLSCPMRNNEYVFVPIIILPEDATNLYQIFHTLYLLQHFLLLLSLLQVLLLLFSIGKTLVGFLIQYFDMSSVKLSYTKPVLLLVSLSLSWNHQYLSNIFSSPPRYNLCGWFRYLHSSDVPNNEQMSWGYLQKLFFFHVMKKISWKINFNHNASYICINCARFSTNCMLFGNYFCILLNWYILNNFDIKHNLGKIAKK